MSAATAMVYRPPGSVAESARKNRRTKAGLHFSDFLRLRGLVVGYNTRWYI